MFNSKLSTHGTQTVHVTGGAAVMFSFAHVMFTNVRFTVDEGASLMFACDSVRFNVKVCVRSVGYLDVFWGHQARSSKARMSTNN